MDYPITTQTSSIATTIAWDALQETRTASREMAENGLSSLLSQLVDYQQDTLSLAKLISSPQALLLLALGADVDCFNENECCGVWNEFGYCNSNPTYMTASCKASCG
ncbi:hypothetical protein OSTOST_25485, partial [Ostertagia ostertagi]